MPRSIPDPRRHALSLLFGTMFLMFSVAGCTRDTDTSTASGGPAADTKPSGPPVTLTVLYGSEKKTWLEECARSFEATGPKTTAGAPITIDARAMGSGEAVQALLSGDVKAHVFSPASAVYTILLNDAWMAQPGHTKAISPAGDPLVLSPLVIAMWKPMATALGWPDKSISWSDLLKINADPGGWAARGHPEWGVFKLGHTHPEFSNSGLLAVLAEAYAGAKKTRGLAAADLDDPATRKLVSDVEGTIVHYGKSTGFFADKMLARGPAYLSAAVLYENLVIESYQKQSGQPFPLVAVYPIEGTFWSDHPYAVLDADWVGPEHRDAAAAFLAFLKAKPQQERAMALGFRPADPSIPVGAPIDLEHGVDPKQPQTLLELPDGATLQKLLELWRSTKKSTDVVLVFDKSGSMRGEPMANAKTGARAFLDSLHAADDVTLVFFDSRVYPPVGPVKLETGKPLLQERIDGMIADGGTALYDATAKAYDIARERAEKNPRRIHAVVVMTDGNDENSRINLPTLSKQLPREGEAPVKLFTIAYGENADPKVLEQIAEAAQGSSAKGSVESIGQVYRDMASFF